MSTNIRIRFENSSDLATEAILLIQKEGIEIQDTSSIRGFPPTDVIVTLASAGAFITLYQIICRILEKNKGTVIIERKGAKITVTGYGLLEVLEFIKQFVPEELQPVLLEQENIYGQLLQVLDKSFNEEELKSLSFILAIDYDNLPAQGKVNKARELVKYLDRQGDLSKLVETIKQLRSDIQDIPSIKSERSMQLQVVSDGRVLPETESEILQ